MQNNINSLRQYLQGALSDFANSSDLLPLVSNTTLTSLVVQLANLREEGSLLIPEVFLSDNLEDALKLLPDREVIQIGTSSNATSAIAEGIKKCGPLAIDGWCVFISKYQDRFKYGVFRGSLNPTSISINETLFSTPLDGIKLVRLFRTATGCVELCNHTGKKHSILLNDKPESDPLPNAYTSELLEIICRDVKTSLHDPIKTYLGKTIDKALANCHGTIIVVTAKSRIPAFLKDGVILQAPLNFLDAISAKQETTQDNNAEHRLIASSSLVQGMISSDGITVFSTNGSLIAYNCFIHSSIKTAGKPIIGGARTRAYETLKRKIGNGICAVFIQSQDGWTKFSKEKP
jgi:hypothetical protein